MKYVMAWTTRLGGSGKENEESVRRGLEVFSKWQPAKGTTIHQFVGRLDAEGGFAVVETDNPAEVLEAAGKFAPFIVYQVYPVVDVGEWAQGVQAGVDFRASIG
jgi:hypothetical protein